MDFIKIEKVDDYKVTLPIREVVFIKEQKVPKELELDEYDKDAMHFAAYYADKVVGCMRVREFDSYFKIERVAVLKEHRGKGISIELMRYVESCLNELSTTKHIELNAQAEVEKFYHKLGYISIGEYFYEATIKHIKMKKTSNFGGPF
jgi:predicted GNAT family N-acyltransferase